MRGGPGEGRGVVYTALVVCNYFNTQIPFEKDELSPLLLSLHFRSSVHILQRLKFICEKPHKGVLVGKGGLSGMGPCNYIPTFF